MSHSSKNSNNYYYYNNPILPYSNILYAPSTKDLYE